MARSVIYDFAMAQDVTQEVFLEVWDKGYRFDPAKGSATGWIMRLARSRAIDRVRHAQRSRVRDTTWQHRQTLTDFDVVTETVLLGVEHFQLTRALATLSALQQQAISLVYFHGYSTAQVSGMLLIPASTVKTRCRDALLTLRRSLGEPR